MSEGKHTPGPWRVSTCNGNHVLKDNDNHKSKFHGTTIMVANCDYQQTSVGGSKQANARLIAAAPELLEAARAVLAWIEDHQDEQWRHDHEASAEMLRAALAKAEKGQP